MVESRCGLLCSQCGYRESMGCTGCVRIEKPFWGEKCPVKSCCEERRLDHCGLCGAGRAAHVTRASSVSVPRSSTSGSSISPPPS